MGYLAGGANNVGINVENRASFVITGGSVGVGTSTPAAPLDVFGAIHANTTITEGGNITGRRRNPQNCAWNHQLGRVIFNAWRLYVFKNLYRKILNFILHGVFRHSDRHGKPSTRPRFDWIYLLPGGLCKREQHCDRDAGDGWRFYDEPIGFIAVGPR